LLASDLAKQLWGVGWSWYFLGGHNLFYKWNYSNILRNAYPSCQSIHWNTSTLAAYHIVRACCHRNKDTKIEDQHICNTVPCSFSRTSGRLLVDCVPFVVNPAGQNLYNNLHILEHWSRKFRRMPMEYLRLFLTVRPTFKYWAILSGKIEPHLIENVMAFKLTFYWSHELAKKYEMPPFPLLFSYICSPYSQKSMIKHSSRGSP